jgi:transposase
MRFVPVKGAEQQAALLDHKARDFLVRQRTQTVNAIRAPLIGTHPSSGLHQGARHLMPQTRRRIHGCDRPKARRSNKALAKGSSIHGPRTMASEELEYVPGRFIVNRIVRPRLTCTCCERFIQVPLPSRPIERGRPGPGLLAHVLVSKYADHLPLYRQSQIFDREGLDLDRSTLADWVGKSTALLEPLADAIGRHVLSAETIFADDTPISMLAPGIGKTRTARLWTYARDERTWGGTASPAA